MAVAAPLIVGQSIAPTKIAKGAKRRNGHLRNDQKSARVGGRVKESLRGWWVCTKNFVVVLPHTHRDFLNETSDVLWDPH